MSKKKALGQGLDALLGGGVELSGSNTADRTEGVRLLPVDKLMPNPDQPRKKFDPEALAELTDSIKQQGVIQPILAEELSDGRYMIIAGERRWRAGRNAGLHEMPVIVRDFTVDQKLEIALVENVQREDLTPMEEARAYQRIMEALGLSQQEVASKVGKNRSTVANSLRLLKLPAAMVPAVESGQVSAGHARAILSITDPAGREKLFQKILDQSLSVREAEKTAVGMNRSSGDSEKTPPPRKDPEFESLEQRFMEALGTKVTLRGDTSRGRLEISWYNKEDLNRIYEMLTGEN